MKTRALVSSRLVVPALAAAVLAALNPLAQAATYTWTKTAANTYNWDDAISNWTAGFPNAAGDIANLNIDIAGSQAINLNQAITLGALNIGDTTTGFFSETFNAGTAGSFIFDNSGAGATITTSNVATGIANVINANVTLNDNLIVNAQSTSALTINGNVGETGSARGLTKSGTATLILTGANSYTGATTISATGGTLQLGSAGTTGSLSASSAISIGTGSTFTVNRTNAVTQGTDFSSAAITGAGGFTQAGTGTTTLNVANSYSGPTSVTAGTLSLTGSLTGGGAISVTSAGAFSQASTGVISGASTFTQNVVGGLSVLGGTNTYAGATTVTAGILRLAGGAAIADTSTIANIATGGLLDLNGTSETVAAITASPGSVSLGAGALTLASNNASTITGLIYGAGGSIVKNGTGTLTLTTAQGSGNSFSSGNLFSGGITNAVGGTLTINSANAAGTGLITTAGALNISSSQLLLSGGITVNGGTTALSNAFTGGTGTVTLNSGGTLTLSGNAAAVQLASVVLNGGTFTTPVLATNFGSLAGSQGFTAGAFGLSFGSNNTPTATYSGNIAGAVASNITKTGTGIQILNGTNATTGTITANGSGGTLEIGGQYASSTNVAAQSGTLRLNFDTAGALVTTNLVGSAPLSLSGGTLAIQGKNSAINSIQNFTTTTTTAGTSSVISVTNGSSTGTAAVNIGGITRNAGSTINFNLPTGTQIVTNGIVTTTGGTSGLFVGTGAQAYTTVNGTDFAAKNITNNVVALTGSVTAVGGTTLTGTATDNADINGGNISVSAASTINTLHFNDATAGRTLTLGGALTVTDSGILISSANAAGSSITGGSITSATDVIIHQFSNQPFTLNAPVTGGVILSKTGPGTLILTAANTNSGITYINSGTLQIGAGGSLVGSVVNLAVNDPTAVFNLNNQTTSVSNLLGGTTIGGYVNFGAGGTLNNVGNNSSNFQGSLVGGVDSVFNKTVGSQGIQGANQAFYGTLNISAGGSIGVFGQNGFINATVNVNNTGGFNQGSAGTIVQLGNLGNTGAGVGGTLTPGSNSGGNGTYNIGYLGGASSFSGVIANGALGGTAALGKFGSGTTTLSGNNTYTGATQVNSGGLIFDYSTGSTTPLATGSALTVGGGTVTFKGLTAGGTTATTGTFGVNNSVLSRVVLDNNTAAGGITANLKTTLVNSVSTLASTSVFNSVLFDTSSVGTNVLRTDLAIGAAGFTASDTIGIRTNNGILTTGLTSNTGYRANILIKDSTGTGFATTSGTSIVRYTGATSLTALDTGTTLLETGAGNYKLNFNLTRTAQFLYNTIELDSSAGAVTLTDNTGNRFGGGGGNTTSGRGVLATGSNGATITSSGGTNQATYFNNYQTGTTAGQTLTLNMTLGGVSVLNGTGLTVATGIVGGSDQYFQSGVIRLTGAQASGDALLANGGAYRLVGGILEIGADLTGSASPTSSADFSRSVGGGTGQVQLLGDTGFSAFGANRTVNLGGNGQQLLWGNDNFLASTVGTTTEGNNTFKLSSVYSDSRIDFQNAIALGNVTRNVDVANGSAALDARLSGVLSGVFAPTVTQANSAPGVLNAAAGLTKQGLGTLELTAANTYRGRTTVSAGTLLVNNSTGSGTGTGSVVVSSGATLGGSGTISGAVNVNALATLTGGTAGTSAATAAANVGTLSTGALTLASTAVLSLDIGAGGSTFDKILVTGAVDVTGATLTLHIDSGFVYTSPLLLIDNDGSDLITGTFASLAEGSTITADGFTFTATYINGGNDFALVAVPEPSTYIGGGLILGLAAFSQRRRLFTRSMVA